MGVVTGLAVKLGMGLLFLRGMLEVNMSELIFRVVLNRCCTVLFRMRDLMVTR
jgi:hypothetical protein